MSDTVEVYYKYKFPRPSVTATLVVIRVVDGKPMLVLGRRSLNSGAYPGYWALCGGFLDAKVAMEDYHFERVPGSPAREPQTTVTLRAGETLEQAICREAKEEFDLDITPVDVVLYHNSSHPDTDPRCHVINACYYVVIDADVKLTPGDDVIELSEVPLEQWYQSHPVLAFDHASLIHIFSKRAFSPPILTF
ncbi:hypothetical protein CCP3SC15_730022 [Gammaproteobacteria bacterium]